MYYYKRKKILTKTNIIIVLVSCAVVLTGIIATYHLAKDDLKSAVSAYSHKKYHAALKQFMALSDSGNAEAQKYLGLMYFQGEGVAVNYETAVKWFTRASNQDNARAQHFLAVCYLNGLGVQRDLRKALQLEVQAAANRQKIAQVTYVEPVKVIEDNHIIKRDRSAAKNESQGGGKPVAARKETDDRTKALLESFIKDSGDGNAEAAYLLGLTFSDGKRLEPDSKEAEKWFRKSANEGNVSAQTNLGMIYFLGHGVLQDYAEAAHWFNEAAQKGSRHAQFMLGNLYASGHGVPLDYARAAALYAAAAENKHSLAKCYLAELFSKGMGVFQNVDMARILCQEGYRESESAVCSEIWETNFLGTTRNQTPSL